MNEAAGQKYSQAAEFRYQGGRVRKGGKLTKNISTTEAEQRGRASARAPGPSSTDSTHRAEPLKGPTSEAGAIHGPRGASIC